MNWLDMREAEDPAYNGTGWFGEEPQGRPAPPRELMPKTGEDPRQPDDGGEPGHGE